MRHEVDFIKVNGRNARHSKLERPSSATALDELKKKEDTAMAEYNKGEVPA